MKKLLIFPLVFMLLSPPAAGQDFAFPDLRGFRTVTEYPVYLPDNLWDFINGAADGFLALGFRDLNVAEYRKGKNSIKLEIYRHENHTMAFGIYASERSPHFNFLRLGAQGYNVDGAINFFKGNFYVKIRTYSQKAKILQAAETLAYRVADMLPGESTMPALLARFPAEGKVSGEEVYINDNVLGHSILSSAFMASYETGNDSFNIYLIQKDSEEEIRDMAKAYLNTAGVETFPGDENRFVFTDGYNGTIFLSWKDDLMVIISGLAKDQTAIAFRYTTGILE